MDRPVDPGGRPRLGSRDEETSADLGPTARPRSASPLLKPARACGSTIPRKYPPYRPQTFDIFCVKHAAYLRHIQYDRWTSTTATGSATLSVRHAENGPYQTSPVDIHVLTPGELPPRHWQAVLAFVLMAASNLKIGPCEGAGEPNWGMTVVRDRTRVPVRRPARRSAAQTGWFTAGSRPSRLDERS